MILIINRQKKISIDGKKLQSAMGRMLASIGYDKFDVGLLLTTNASIKKYNLKYRNKNNITDVLSFPYHETLKDGENIKINHPEDKNLGDIVISVEYSLKKAAEAKTTLFDYLLKIIAHSIAHLLGYKHDTDSNFSKMLKMEKKILN
jgi:probable rRNA maturation factor